jgi:hypothetical protein
LEMAVCFVWLKREDAVSWSIEIIIYISCVINSNFDLDVKCFQYTLWIILCIDTIRIITVHIKIILQYDDTNKQSVRNTVLW